MIKISFKTKDGLIKITNIKKVTNPYKGLRDPKRAEIFNQINKWKRKTLDEWKKFISGE